MPLLVYPPSWRSRLTDEERDTAWENLTKTQRHAIRNPRSLAELKRRALKRRSHYAGVAPSAKRRRTRALPAYKRYTQEWKRLDARRLAFASTRKCVSRVCEISVECFGQSASIRALRTYYVAFARDRAKSLVTCREKKSGEITGYATLTFNASLPVPRDGAYRDQSSVVERPFSS